MGGEEGGGRGGHTHLLPEQTQRHHHRPPLNSSLPVPFKIKHHTASLEEMLMTRILKGEEKRYFQETSFSQETFAWTQSVFNDDLKTFEREESLQSTGSLFQLKYHLCCGFKINFFLLQVEHFRLFSFNNVIFTYCPLLVWYCSVAIFIFFSRCYFV